MVSAAHLTATNSSSSTALRFARLAAAVMKDQTTASLTGSSSSSCCRGLSLPFVAVGGILTDNPSRHLPPKLKMAGTPWRRLEPIICKGLLRRTCEGAEWTRRRCRLKAGGKLRGLGGTATWTVPRGGATASPRWAPSTAWRGIFRGQYLITIFANIYNIYRGKGQSRS